MTNQYLAACLQLGALSSNGRSKTFDASADGYGRGEAAIVFVLRGSGEFANKKYKCLAKLHSARCTLHAVIHSNTHNSPFPFSPNAVGREA